MAPVMTKSISLFCIASCALSLSAAEIRTPLSLQELSRQFEDQLIAIGLQRNIARVVIDIEKKEAQYNSFGEEAYTHFTQRITKAVSRLAHSEEPLSVLLQPYLNHAYKWDDALAVKTLVAFGVKKTD